MALTRLTTSSLDYQTVVAGFLTLALAISVPFLLVWYSKKREKKDNGVSRLMNL